MTCRRSLDSNNRKFRVFPATAICQTPASLLWMMASLDTCAILFREYGSEKLGLNYERLRVHCVADVSGNCGRQYPDDLGSTAGPFSTRFGQGKTRFGCSAVGRFHVAGTGPPLVVPMRFRLGRN